MHQAQLQTLPLRFTTILSYLLYSLALLYCNIFVVVCFGFCSEKIFQSFSGGFEKIERKIVETWGKKRDAGGKGKETVEMRRRNREKISFGGMGE